MIDVDLRQYGTDKEYQEAVNKYLKGTSSPIFDTKPIELEAKFDDGSLKKLNEMFTIPEDITEKIVDIYNYMATTKAGKIYLQFETGIKMVCEIDATEWKNPPKVDLNDALKGVSESNG